MDVFIIEGHKLNLVLFSWTFLKSVAVFVVMPFNVYSSSVSSFLLEVLPFCCLWCLFHCIVSSFLFAVLPVCCLWFLVVLDVCCLVYLSLLSVISIVCGRYNRSSVLSVLLFGMYVVSAVSHLTFAVLFFSCLCCLFHPCLVLLSVFVAFIVRLIVRLLIHLFQVSTVCYVIFL